MPSTSDSDQRVGLLDTSVVIDWADPAVADKLPALTAISAITAAELAAGPHLAHDAAEAARRQTRLQEIESIYEPIGFDAAVARSYGLVVAAVMTAGRRHRSRVADLLIAATAHANDFDLYTRNPDDFEGLADLVKVIPV